MRYERGDFLPKAAGIQAAPEQVKSRLITKMWLSKDDFTEIFHRAFGSYSCKTDISFTFQIRKLNYLLQQAMVGYSFVYPVDLLSLQLQMGVAQWHNSALYYDTKLACDINALPHFSKCIVDILKAMKGRVKKCVVLDLDNTL